MQRRVSAGDWLVSESGQTESVTEANKHRIRSSDRGRSEPDAGQYQRLVSVNDGQRQRQASVLSVVSA